VRVKVNRMADPLPRAREKKTREGEETSVLRYKV
jgi:hypothetical protein